MVNFKAILDGYLDDELTEDQHRELAVWMAQSPENVDLFVKECRLDSHLQDVFREEQLASDALALTDDEGMLRTNSWDDDQTELDGRQRCSSLPTALPNLSPAPSTGGFLLTDAIHHTVGYLSTGWPAAYLLATLLTGLGLFVALLVPVFHPTQFAKDVAPSKSLPVAPKMSFVGRITGMVDCQWADESMAAFNGSSVPLGRKYVLASGLLEITYDTGARVILQGPVTYEVESAAGGYLSVGKLAARVEKKEERRTKNEELLDSRSSFLIPHSYFAIRTPTATVTDLGTEFGVSVSANQAADVCVFEGTVEVSRAASSVGSNATNVPRRLAANEAARFEVTGAVQSLSTDGVLASFVRKLPASRVPTKLERGLVAYWSFDDAVSLGKNAAGGGDLTPLGSPVHDAAGVIGGALRVDRDVDTDSLLYNDGRGLPNGVPTGDSSYSISVWYRVDAIPLHGSFDIVGWGEPALSRANAVFLYCNESPDKCMVRNYWWDNDNFGVADMPAASGGWRHVVSTYDSRGRMQYLYLDGERIGLRAVEQRPDIGPNNFAIGHRHLSPGPSLECVGGMIDEVGIWNRELFEPEVWQLYNHGNGFNPLAAKTSTLEK